MKNKVFELILKEDGIEVIHNHMEVNHKFEGIELECAILDAWQTEQMRQLNVKG